MATKADPKYSAGARTERASFRKYLRTRLKAVAPGGVVNVAIPLEAREVERALDWVLKRQERYDKKKGGLGRTK